jgi:hypothetical protein
MVEKKKVGGGRPPAADKRRHCSDWREGHTAGLLSTLATTAASLTDRRAGWPGCRLD